MIIDKQFRDIVNARLEELEWSRADLSRALGVSPQMISQYLNGDKLPGSDVIDRFFDALGIEPVLGFKVTTSKDAFQKAS